MVSRKKDGFHTVYRVTDYTTENLKIQNSLAKMNVTIAKIEDRNMTLKVSPVCLKAACSGTLLKMLPWPRTLHYDLLP